MNKHKINFILASFVFVFLFGIYPITADTQTPYSDCEVYGNIQAQNICYSNSSQCDFLSNYYNKTEIDNLKQSAITYYFWDVVSDVIVIICCFVGFAILSKKVS